MMLLLVVLSVAVSGAFADGGNAPALSIDLRPYNFTAAILFVGNDLNNDSMLTRQEFDKVFEQYDYNGDKIIERHEYVCYLTSEDEYMAHLAHALFDVYDINHDHKMKVEDFDAFFKKMDTDANGTVSDVEFIRFWTQLLKDTEAHSLHGHPHPLHHDHYCDEHGITKPTTAGGMMSTTAPAMTTTGT